MFAQHQAINRRPDKRLLVPRARLLQLRTSQLQICFGEGLILFTRLVVDQRVMLAGFLIVRLRDLVFARIALSFFGRHHAGGPYGTTRRMSLRDRQYQGRRV